MPLPVPKWECGKIVLVGMPGAGKTAGGSVLAERLGWRFVDVDALIEKEAGMDVAGIFASPEFGEPGFRRLERGAIARIIDDQAPAVIATGGGAVEDGGTRQLLASSDALVVWLSADLEVLLARVGEGKSRPLLSSDPTGNLASLLRMREKMYEEEK